MKTLLKPLLAATLLSLTMGSAAMAKPSHGGDKTHHCTQKSDRGHHAKGMQKPHQPRFLKGIDLTDTQKDQIFALTDNQVPKMREHMQARRALKKELRALSGNYSEAKVKVIADKLAVLERDSVLARARHQHSIMNLLTAAQKKQVAENKDKFKQRHDSKSDNEKVSARGQQGYRHAVM